MPLVTKSPTNLYNIINRKINSLLFTQFSQEPKYLSTSRWFLGLIKHLTTRADSYLEPTSMIWVESLGTSFLDFSSFSIIMFPEAMDSCFASNFCKSSFKARPWQSNDSSLKHEAKRVYKSYIRQNWSSFITKILQVKVKVITMSSLQGVLLFVYRCDIG